LLNNEGGPQIDLFKRTKSVFAGHEPDFARVRQNDDGWLWEFPTTTSTDSSTTRRTGDEAVGPSAYSTTICTAWINDADGCTTTTTRRATFFGRLVLTAKVGF
jgi:hypothetical protein